MKVHTAYATIDQVRLVVALVTCDLIGPAGDDVLRGLDRQFPGLPIMLVCRDGDRLRAYATFQTERLLPLLQLEWLAFKEIDIDKQAPTDDVPF